MSQAHPPGRASAARPDRAALQAAYGATVRDLVGPRTRLLFVGINPSLWSAAVGAHFARPGNRFWRTLAEAGLTPRLMDPHDTDGLRASGLGITNLVARATARADELSAEELRAGVPRLRRLVRRHRPPVVAVLGVSAYRTAFERRSATVGRQPEPFGDAMLWVLPNPSGLNAHYQQPALTAAYRRLAGGPGPEAAR